MTHDERRRNMAQMFGQLSEMMTNPRVIPDVKELMAAWQRLSRKMDKLEKARQGIGDGERMVMFWEIKDQVERVKAQKTPEGKRLMALHDASDDAALELEKFQALFEKWQYMFL